MMKKKHDLLGFLLAVITGTALLIALLVHAFFPRVILPQPNAMLLISLSLAALVLDHYLTYGGRRNYWLIPIYGVVIFGIFPLAAFYVTPMAAMQLAGLGAVILTALTFLFDTIIDRLSDGPSAKAAPLISAFGLFLAAQCLMGIF